MLLAKLMSLFLLGLVRFLTGAQARWYGCPPRRNSASTLPTTRAMPTS
ncbi:hypothetical protein [Paenacidovorax monticola]